MASLGLPRRVGVIVALGLIALFVVYAFFNAFVTELWYQSRQRSMGAVGGSALAAKPGQPVGVLQVKQPFTLNVEISQGDGPAELRAGPGHRPGTPLPGNLGNSVVYGRASEWGGPFRDLHMAQPGTEMYVQTRLGSTDRSCPTRSYQRTWSRSQRRCATWGPPTTID